MTKFLPYISAKAREDNIVFLPDPLQCSVVQLGASDVPCRASLSRSCLETSVFLAVW